LLKDCCHRDDRPVPLLIDRCRPGPRRTGQSQRALGEHLEDELSTPYDSPATAREESQDSTLFSGVMLELAGDPEPSLPPVFSAAVAPGSFGARTASGGPVLGQVVLDNGVEEACRLTLAMPPLPTFAFAETIVDNQRAKE
jgi:hypothetical protein